MIMTNIFSETIHGKVVDESKMIFDINFSDFVILRAHNFTVVASKFALQMIFAM